MDSSVGCVTRRMRHADASAAGERGGLSSLPQALLRRILALLPVDQRARSAVVHPSWRDALADRSLWTALDLSPACGIARERISHALLCSAAARAGGQLVSLDLTECYGINFEVVLEVVTANARSMRVLRLQRNTYALGDHVDGYKVVAFRGNERHELEALLQAAPGLQLLEADLFSWRGPSRSSDLCQMLRREERFAPLRIGHLAVGSPDVAGLTDLMAVLATHAPLSSLQLSSAPLDEPAALDAVVDAAVASQLTSLRLYMSPLGPEAAPALVRLLSSTSLTKLRIAYDGPYLLLDQPAALLLATALRANRTLTMLELHNALWHVPAAGAALFSSLVAHPSLRSLIWRETGRVLHAAIAGSMVHALLVADAPALQYL
jgi:hypothetical protein